MSDLDAHVTEAVLTNLPATATIVHDHTTIHQLTDTLFRVNATAVCEGDDTLTYYLHVLVIDQHAGRFRVVSNTSTVLDALPYIF